MELTKKVIRINDEDLIFYQSIKSANISAMKLVNFGLHMMKHDKSLTASDFTTEYRGHTTPITVYYNGLYQIFIDEIKSRYNVAEGAIIRKGFTIGMSHIEKALSHHDKQLSMRTSQRGNRRVRVPITDEQWALFIEKAGKDPGQTLLTLILDYLEL